MRTARTALARATHAALLAGALACLPACGEHETADAGARGAGSTASASTVQVPRDEPLLVRAHVRSERLDRLRRALERLDRGAAEPLLDAAREAGPEEPLLRARFLALEKSGTFEALRLVESARAADPTNPEVYATAAEIYAANEAFDTAWSEIERGQKACGNAVEFARARGVTWLCREGGAAKGVEHLLRARAADPTLPFVERPLAEGHLLLAKLAQKDQKLERAEAQARASLALAPDSVDARRVLSEVLGARGDFAGAIALVQGLVAEGVPLEAELALLSKKAGIAALLENDRPRAIAHFRAARAHGLSDAELASGALVLEQESLRRVEAAVRLARANDARAAEAELREALLDDPQSLSARHHLALVLAARGADLEAAELWRGVLATARAEHIDLPDPVHLNLAAVLVHAGAVEEARGVLEAFLAHEPSGEWAERTRAELARLPAPR